MRRGVTVTLFLLGLVLFSTPLMAQVTQSVIVVASCGAPTYAASTTFARYLTMDLNGKLCVNATVNAQASGKSTAAAPSYTEGSTNPLSTDLSGNLRVVGTFAISQCTSSTCTSTVVQPTAANFNATVVQSTAANLNATVVQSTAANLNATVVGTGTFGVQAAQSGTWNVNNRDGSGNSITSTSGAMDVNIKSQNVNPTEVQLDYDTSGSTQNLSIIGLALPASGGAVAGGTQANPITVQQATATISSKPALTNSASQVNGVATTLASFYCYNPNSVVGYLQLYNSTSGGTTVGASVIESYGIPAASAAGLTNLHKTFSTALTVAATTTYGGSTALTTGLDCTLGYK